MASGHLRLQPTTLKQAQTAGDAGHSSGNSSPTSPIEPSRPVASKHVRRSDYRCKANALGPTAAGAFTTPIVNVFTTKLPSLAVDWTRIEYDLRAL